MKSIIRILKQLYHLKPSCQSRQDIKNVLTAGVWNFSRKNFCITRLLKKQMHYQLSKGLLLVETAEVNTKPELEIYADDVKCSHGSTSRIDNNALFYLKTRGLKREEGIKMIVKGFLESVLKDITNKEIINVLENHFNTHIKYESRTN